MAQAQISIKHILKHGENALGILTAQDRTARTRGEHHEVTHERKHAIAVCTAMLAMADLMKGLGYQHLLCDAKEVALLREGGLGK